MSLTLSSSTATAPKAVIVQIVQHLVPGGIETLTLELLRAAPPDTEVHIVSLEGNHDESLAKWPRLQSCSAQLHFLEKPPGFQPALFLRLARLLWQLKATAVHTHHMGPLLYGGLAARMCGISRWVHTEHDAWYLNAPKAKKLVSQCLRWLRPTLIADANNVAIAVQNAIPSARPGVIYNGIDTRRFIPGNSTLARQRLGLPDQGFMVGCAARLEHVKGIDLAIQAIARLPENYQLVIAGQGSQRELLGSLAQQLGVQHRVHFLGLVDDMTRFYQSLDIFCLPSRAEGLPLSALEAQACGIRTLVTRVGGTREALCPDTGLSVPPESPKMLANMMVKARQLPSPTSPRHFVVAARDLQDMAGQYFSLLTRPSSP